MHVAYRDAACIDIYEYRGLYIGTARTCLTGENWISIGSQVMCRRRCGSAADRSYPRLWSRKKPFGIGGYVYIALLHLPYTHLSRFARMMERRGSHIAQGGRGREAPMGGTHTRVHRYTCIYTRAVQKKRGRRKPLSSLHLLKLPLRALEWGTVYMYVCSTV